MADIADIANDLRDSEIDNLIKNRARVGDISGSGKCLYCEEPVEGKRWCDEHCRADWERQEAAKNNRAARVIE